MLLISQILIWVFILVLAGAVLALARQVGVLHARIAPVGARTMAKGPQPGEAVPKVSGRTLAGTRMDIAAALSPGSLRLLLFVSPTCPVCKALLPTARKLAEQEGLDLILVGDGEEEEYRAMAERYGIAPERFINGPPVGRAFQVGKLPHAVLISEQGIIVAQGLVNTREHLESLIVAHETGLSSVQEYIKARQPRSPATSAQS